MSGTPTPDAATLKAATLVEALPYIRRFAGKTVVVKYGGNALAGTSDHDALTLFAEDVVLMRRSVPADCQVKGSGGIRDLDTVLALRAVGATRCGVSATEKIMEEAQARFAAGDLIEPPLDDLSFEEGGSY